MSVRNFERVFTREVGRRRPSTCFKCASRRRVVTSNARIEAQHVAPMLDSQRRRYEARVRRLLGFTPAAIVTGGQAEACRGMSGIVIPRRTFERTDRRGHRSGALKADAQPSVISSTWRSVKLQIQFHQGGAMCTAILCIPAHILLEPELGARGPALPSEMRHKSWNRKDSSSLRAVIASGSYSAACGTAAARREAMLPMNLCL